MKFAEEKDATPAQIALAWLLAKKAWILPTPRTTKVSRLEEDLGCATFALSVEDVRALEEVSSVVKVEGGGIRLRMRSIHSCLVTAQVIAAVDGYSSARIAFS
jgi:diketogulonate reductase-like aldo/keto reductase